jgi:hypothetical protein
MQHQQIANLLEEYYVISFIALWNGSPQLVLDAKPNNIEVI